VRLGVVFTSKRCAPTTQNSLDGSMAPISRPHPSFWSLLLVITTVLGCPSASPAEVVPPRPASGIGNAPPARVETTLDERDRPTTVGQGDEQRILLQRARDLGLTSDTKGCYEAYKAAEKLGPIPAELDRVRATTYAAYAELLVGESKPEEALPVVIEAKRIAPQLEGLDEFVLEIQQKARMASTPRTAVPLTGAVELETDVDVADGKPVIRGKTNLPDGTKLGVRVAGARGYAAAADAVAANGAFTAGPFTANHAPLPTGSYEVRIVMPVPNVQPEAVRAVIGENGEHLKGRLVKRGDLGVIVESNKSFHIGASESVARAEDARATAAIKLEARATFDGVTALLAEGRGMDGQRNSASNETLRRCGERMRKLQAEARALRARADGLPLSFIDLKIAANGGNIDLCVSCSPRLAPASCIQTAAALKRAASVVKR